MERATTPTAKIIFRPGPEYAEAKRLWQGCPSLCRTPAGTLYGGWYTGGTREPAPENYNLLVRSDDGGFTWSRHPLLVVAADYSRRKISYDNRLWLDPAGRMWLFWAERDCTVRRSDPRNCSTFAIRCDEPDAPEMKWSEPRFITSGFLGCKPTVLSDGRWLLPAYDWTCDRYSWCESSDNGESFRRRTGGRKVGTPFDEGMFYETADGAEIRLLIRSAAGYIAESVSRDGGKTWTDGASSGITAPDSKLYVRRLRSGRLLLIRNDHASERDRLTAQLSEDDGRTWPWKLLLDDGCNVSYPDAEQLEDGDIVALYDHGRNGFKEIVAARFNETDILHQRSLKDDTYTRSFLKHIVSKPPVPIRGVYEKLWNETQAWVEKQFEFWDAPEP